MKGKISASFNARYFFVAILLVLSFGLKSQDLSAKYFLEGNQAYASKQYEVAIENYTRILALGKENATIYYNIGNAYYRLKNYPLAILNYERSLKLSPRNADTKYNLALANSMIVDKIEVVPQIFYNRWWNDFLALMSLNTFSMLSILALALSMLLWGLFLINSNNTVRLLSSWTAGILLFSFLIFLIASVQKKNKLLNTAEAIVLTPTLNVKSSPDETSSDVFIIHEGTKVTLLDTITGWQEIKIANGSVGWIMTTEIKKI